MQQQERVVLGVSLVVTLVSGWVQFGAAQTVASAEEQACTLIEKGMEYCPLDTDDECRRIAANYGCSSESLTASSCTPFGPLHYVLRCEFDA